MLPVDRLRLPGVGMVRRGCWWSFRGFMWRMIPGVVFNLYGDGYYKALGPAVWTG